MYNRALFSLAEELQTQGWGTMKQPHHLQPREKPISSQFMWLVTFLITTYSLIVSAT